MIPASAFIFYFILLHEGFQNSKKKLSKELELDREAPISPLNYDDSCFRDEYCPNSE